MNNKHFALAFAFIGSIGFACGGQEGDFADEELAQDDESITIYPYLDVCKSQAADATANMGSGSSSKASVELFSGAIDYSDSNRLCERFIADIIVPGTHQTPGSHDPAIRFAADQSGSNPNTEAACEAMVVNARFYERTDTLTYNGSTFSWNNGSFSSLGSIRLRGSWSSGDLFTGCLSMQPESGSFPATFAPTGSFNRKVLRVAIEGHVETANGNIPGLSVATGAYHLPIIY